MLADLVNGGGCVGEGSDVVNNPLSQLGKAVLDAGRQRDLSAHHDVGPAQLAGPSQMLPEMGMEEAAFMRAFEQAPANFSQAWGDAAATMMPIAFARFLTG